MILNERAIQRGATIENGVVGRLVADKEELVGQKMHYGKLPFDSPVVKQESPVDRVWFDQLHQPAAMVEADFKKENWQQLAERLRCEGVDAILPASENGVRQLAVTKFTRSANINLLQVSGGDRELKWDSYIARTPNPDPIDFQKLATRSKFARFYRQQYASPRNELNRKLKNNKHVVTIGFDTLVYLWDSTRERYVPREKPKNEEEALTTIFEMASGAPFLVSTVCLVDKFDTGQSRTGFSTTLIPARMNVHNAAERAEMTDHLMSRYRMIRDLEDKPWKMTPAGASLMHPEVQKHLLVGINEGMKGNVSVGNLSRIIWPTYPNDRITIGDRAIRDYVFERIARPHQYVSMATLPVGLRERVGMVFSGYSEEGMRTALEQYANSVGYKVNPALFREGIMAFHAMNGD